MSDAPERIWVSPWKTDYSRSATDIGSCSYIGDALDGPDPDGSTEYIRADLSDALVAAALEIGANKLRKYNGLMGHEAIVHAVDEVKATTPAEARTALDALLKAEREKALHEAAEVCERIRTQQINGPMPERACFDYEQSILALISEDATDG